jgi:hypothetical protein
MQKVEQAKTVRLNGVQALKRAFLHRGLIFRSEAAPKVMPQPDQKTENPKSKPKTMPQPDSPAAKPDKPKPKKSKPEPSAKSKSAPEKENKTDESYPERVAEGESDKKIESADDENIDKLKSQAEGSKTAKGPEDLRELTAKSQDVLYEATTVWPFTLFPDTIKLDREKLTIANRPFWRVANITSVPVGEIMSAEAIVGPFFGSLHLTFRFFANNERKLNFLTRKDATEIQRLIHGYIIAHRREIDVSSVSREELIKLLTELGQGASD